MKVTKKEARESGFPEGKIVGLSLTKKQTKELYEKLKKHFEHV